MLSPQGAQVLSLVRELRSHKLHHADKKKKKVYIYIYIYIYAMEYYLVIKSNEILMYAIMWMNHENIVLSERRHKRTNILLL